jgi:mannose/fructose/N-acetylgalactosamine-specific phosphotransferase system component IIC
LILALLGGVVGLDTVSCIQAMIARPIVAAPLAGLLLGDAAAGMYVGVLLELVSLQKLPIGAYRGWDTGPAAVVAAAMAAGHESAGVMLITAAAWGVVVGWVGGWTVHQMRRATASLMANEGRAPISPHSLTVRHLSAMGVDFCRATVLTLLALWIAAGLSSTLGEAAARASGAAMAVALVCVALALGGDIRTLVRGRPVVLAMGIGFLVSAIATIWLNLAS